MTRKFTVDEWTLLRNDAEGNISPCLIIPYKEYNIEDPIVQVFENFEEFDHLITADIGIHKTDGIIISSQKPFTGKVVIK